MDSLSTSVEVGVVSTEFQKAAAMLAFLAPAVVWVLMYIFARRKTPEGKTQRYVMLYVNGMVAGCLLGSLCGHVLPNALAGPMLDINFLMIGLGALLIILITKLHRITGPAQYNYAMRLDEEPTAALDMDSQEERPYFSVDPNKSLGTQIAPTLDHVDIIHLRRSIGYLMFAMFVFSIVIEGLFLVVNHRNGSPAGLFVSYYLYRVFEAIAMSGYAIHAMLHRTSQESRGKRSYWILTAVWCLAIIAAGIPFVVEVDPMLVEAAVSHPAMGAFYSFFGGAMLSVAFRFMYLEPRIADRLETVLYLLILVTSFGVTWVTGLWV